MSQSARPQKFTKIFTTFLQLGLTSFGGLVAHLGYFRETFVVRKKWLDEQAYADLVALSQLLPGPASSQVGIGIGLAKGGLPGALAAWLGFTLPSALLLILFGYGVLAFSGPGLEGVLHGLKVVAVAVVAQAVWGMARSLCPDAPRRSFAVIAAAALVMAPGPLVQIGVILAGGVAGLIVLSPVPTPAPVALGIRLSKRSAIISLILFLTLLVGLPLAAVSSGAQSLALIDSFYRSGALVFGGGHVVLPLLQSAVVPNGWVSNDLFLAGYGAAQAVPGPLFTFSAYLGTVSSLAPNGWLGALICLVAIFAPSFLLIIACLPFWDELRQMPTVRKALAGVNAAVVGLLIAALYNPVWTSAILSPGDFVLGLTGFGLLMFWKMPVWLVVILSASAGFVLQSGAGFLF